MQDMTAQAAAMVEGKHDGTQKTTQKTVFGELLDSNLPPEELTVPRLADEAQTVVAAGQVTTTHFLKLTSFYVLANPEILRRLKEELKSAMPSDGGLPPISKLEQLPYLSAVISEGFRKSYGVTQRLPRVSPDAPLVYKSWVIPPGTPVGMTSILMHDNPELFPNPQVFDPDRWLKNDAERRLGKYLVNFSKGTRSCLGMNLAKAEIYLTMATIFHRFDMELFETDWSDVEIVHDHFNPVPKKDSRGVRVLIK
jgi:cytochrome P450